MIVFLLIERAQQGGFRMRKVVLLITLIAAAAVVPAQAKPPKPASPQSKSHKCSPHAAGLRASGTLVTASLSQTTGSGTPKRGDDRYSGTLKVDISRSNHHGPLGEQTYNLTDARVKFSDRDHNHVADDPQPGDRVKIRGKITLLPKKCDATGFTSSATVAKVSFKPPKQ
jgi:uncharacterized protein YdeI (BOF family)